MTLGGNAERITSADGTPIAFERVGDGPSLILIAGVFCSRSTTAPLAAALQQRFMTLNCDRRGRGDGGDTQPYSVEREIEDLGALITDAGGAAAVFGHSSGVTLALRAAAHGLPITKLALYEPPFIVDDSRPPTAGRVRGPAGRVDRHRPGRDAVELYQSEGIGMRDDLVAQLRHAPFRPGMEAIAHTLVYDAMIIGDLTLPTDLAASIQNADARAHRRAPDTRRPDPRHLARRDHARAGEVPLQLADSAECHATHLPTRPQPEQRATMHNQRDIPNPLLPRLEPLVGNWEMRASIGGQLTGVARASFEWLQGRAFLIQRADAGPPLPGAPPEWLANSPFPITTIIGADDASEAFCYAYADARGVCRVYRMRLDDGTWMIWGQSGPEFFQQFTGAFSDDGSTITGRWERSRDGSIWETDFDVTYTKIS